MIYVSAYDTVNILSLAKENPELSVDWKKKIISERWMARTFGPWLMCGPGPEAQVSSKAYECKEQSIPPPHHHFFLAWCTATPRLRHFSGIWQYEGSVSFCLYQMLVTQKLSLIHQSQSWGITTLSCLLLTNMDGESEEAGGLCMKYHPPPKKPT